MATNNKLTDERVLQRLCQFEGAYKEACILQDDDFASECADIVRALREVMACRAALPVADVVAWSSPNEERTCDIRWRRHDVVPGPLYAAPQPAPVVQCPFPCGWDNLNKLAIQDAAFVSRGLVEGEEVTEAQRKAVIANNGRLLKVISACRAAMLKAGNSPVTTDTWIPVSERMPPQGVPLLVCVTNGAKLIHPSG